MQQWIYYCNCWLLKVYFFRWRMFTCYNQRCSSMNCMLSYLTKQYYSYEVCFGFLWWISQVHYSWWITWWWTKFSINSLHFYTYQLIYANQGKFPNVPTLLKPCEENDDINNGLMKRPTYGNKKDITKMSCSIG